MKRVILSLLFMGILPFAESQEWKVLYPKVTENHLFSVCFPDESVGFAAGSFGTVIRTEDGGVKWENLPVGTNHHFYSVNFPTIETGYVGGEKGKIFKTTDAGNTWQELESGTGLMLTSLYFTDQQTGYAVGGEDHPQRQVILKTSDGGNRWDSLTTGTYARLTSVFFPARDLGYAVGDSGLILKTTDGGLSWVRQVSGVSTLLTSVFFIDPEHGFVTCYSRTILQTTDGGITWSKLEIPGLLLFHDITFPDAQTGYVSGWDYYSYDVMILKTRDGGLTWTKIVPPAHGEIYSSFFSNPDHGVAVGLYGAILKTDDGGSSWYNPNFFTMEGFGSSCFLDRNTVFAGASNGTILKTSNGGQDWEILTTGYTEGISKISFTSSDVGFCLDGTWSDHLLKTMDGGVSWEKRVIDTIGWIVDFHAVNQTIIYAVSLSGKIYKSDDSGMTWSVQYSETDGSLRSVSFVDENNGYVAGEYDGYPPPDLRLFFLKTTDGGAIWNKITPAMPYMLHRETYFLTPEIGFAIADSVHPPHGFRVLKTIDGGVTWENTYTGLSTWFTSITFTDLNTGYLTGRFGRIIKTTDQGNTWVDQDSGLTSDLWSICAPDASTAYAFGGYGVILKHDATIGFGTLDESVSGIKLYPNPADESISGEIPVVPGMKKISVFNLTGREMVSETTMENDFNLNVSHLSSGLYFIRVTGNSRTETGKFIKE